MPLILPGGIMGKSNKTTGAGLISREDLALVTDLYELTMAQSYFSLSMNARASFELYIRDLPPVRNYLVSAGLKDTLDDISSLRFKRRAISYLKSLNLFTDEFLDFLGKFRFRGDVYAVDEGRVVFAGEPLLRVEGSLIEAQLLETMVMNNMSFQTMIASKSRRIVDSAAGRAVVDFSPRRDQGYEAALKAARASYIGGFSATSNVLAGKRLGISVTGTMAHSYVLSFNREIDAFRAFSHDYPDNSVLLIDTYDIEEGCLNAVRVAKEMEEHGKRLKGVRIDSGDLSREAGKVREILDRNRLGYVKIVLSGNLDEYKISRLIKKGTPVDSFGVGTAMGTSSDAPNLNAAYKLVQLEQEGMQRAVMKFSLGKANLPGRKQIFRQYRKGRFVADILGLEGESIEGEALLEKYMHKGRIIRKSPPLEEIRKNLEKEMGRMPSYIRGLGKSRAGTTQLSPALLKSIRTLKRRWTK